MRKNITQFVEQLRNRPEGERKQILSVIMVVTGIVLVLIWIATLGGFSSDVPNKPVLTQSDIRPFQLMKENLIATFHTVADGLHGLRKDTTKSNDAGAAQPVPEPTPSPMEQTPTPDPSVPSDQSI